MPVYTIYLSSSPQSNVQNNDAIPLSVSPLEGTWKGWEINWDSIFKGENYKYQKCKIRTHLITDSITYTSGFNNGSGYLVITSACATNGETTYGGCPLLLTTYQATLTQSTADGRYTILENRLGSLIGIDILPPRNRGVVNFNLNQGDLFGKMSIPVGYYMQFHLQLTFEFY